MKWRIAQPTWRWIAAAAAAGVWLAAPPASGAEPESEDPVISWEDAAEYEGQNVVVEGTLRSVRVKRTYTGNRHCVLGFGPTVDAGLVLRIYPNVYEKFGRRPEVYFRGRKVRARGKVSVREGQPYIVLLSPGRLRRVTDEGHASEDKGGGEAGRNP